MNQRLADPGREPAHGLSTGIPVTHTPAGHIAAADHDVQILGFDDLEHPGQKGLVVLEVAVHHRQEGCGARHHAFDAGRGEPASADTLHQPDTPILSCNGADPVRGPVGRVVVDEDQLPIDPLQHSVDPPDDLVHHVRFLIGRDDDGQLGRTAVVLRHRLIRDPVGHKRRFDSSREETYGARL